MEGVLTGWWGRLPLGGWADDDLADVDVGGLLDSERDGLGDRLRRSGFTVRDDDVQRLSPLGHDHINLLGRYQFSATDLDAGELRPLRDPTAPDP